MLKNLQISYLIESNNSLYIIMLVNQMKFMIPNIENIRHAKEWANISEETCKEYCSLYNMVRKELGGLSNFETIRHITNYVIDSTNKRFNIIHSEYDIK